MRVILLPHHQLAAAAATASPIAPFAGSGGSQTAGTTTSSDGADGEQLGLRGQAEAVPPTWQQQLHKQLSGHKHRRDGGALVGAAAADKRNGSDSGSNSPGDQTPVPHSRLAEAAADAEDAAARLRPAKLPRGRKK